MTLAAPVAAQTRRPLPASQSNTTPSVSFRPFLVVTEQSFAAMNSFKAVFGQSAQPFVGGGLDITLRNGLYLDFTVSRFSKTGQRAFIFGGQTFGLGIPLKVTEMPIEVTAGYRFQRPRSRIVPYVGGGIGSYSYTETSDGSTSSENVDAQHLGYLGVGGVEFRLGRYLGLSGDVQYTYVPKILGTGGISQDAGENNLGGVAARVRLIVGR